MTLGSGNGPKRIKPPLETAADVAYAGRRREELREALRELLERRRRMAELEAHMHDINEREWAEAWIRDHGGSVPAALKRTHPDHGGDVADFRLTQRARAILAR